MLYNFMDILDARGYEVYAITPSESIKWEKGIWKERLNGNNKRGIKNRIKSTVFSYLKKNKKLDQLASWFKILNMNKKLIENWVESDITIATFSWTAYAADYLSNKTISIYHMQHFEELFFQDTTKRFFTRNTYNLPLYKISNSKWLQNLLKTKFNQDSYLLNPGIDLSIFNSKINYKDKYIEKKDWNFVSFFDEKREWKGFNDAAEAIKIARKNLEEKGYTINWNVFGLEPPAKEYDTQFHYCGKLFNEDLADLYKNSDIVLLTSWYESFPLPPIEAMACGSVVISTQYGVEDYLNSNVNGFVVEPRKIEAIAEKIIYAVMHPFQLQAIVERALDTVKNYEWEKRTDQLEKILSLIVKNHSFNKYKLIDDLVSGSFKEYMYQEFKINEDIKLNKES
ncbi:hypothetical protein GCM10007968_21560 [Sporolactobacillus putidus]|uniref:Glycosyl transferase family 1 domain-containing protein n=1 Tax=Sporolactobacillus putidus TaxID=492735 RepID=A0A917S4U3_9BACL|nr:hypothetical protein GCM10007968_21560 [Sporolactobacillus putidus]